MASFTFHRGEPITVDLVVRDAGSYDAAALTAEMDLKWSANGDVPAKTLSPVGSLTVAYTAASGTEYAFWRGTYASTVDLAPGTYVTDAVVKDGVDTLLVTEPQYIKLKESVTP